MEQNQLKPIYVFKVIENEVTTLQFLATNDYELKIANDFKAIQHPKKQNIWMWQITKNQDITLVLQKNKIFTTCFNPNHQKCIDYYHNFLKFLQLQQHTIKCYMSSINLILDQFQSIKTGEIPDFEHIKNYFKQQSWMNSYINQHINALKILFYDLFLIDKEKYRIDRPQNEVRIRKVLSVSERETLTNYQIESETNLLIETALATGLKTNELRNLKLCDILDNKLKIVGTRAREIEIPKHITDKINNYLKTNFIENREYIFCKANGTITTKSTLQRLIREARIELGLERITLKDLRHTFSINSYNNGVIVEEIQEYMGFISFHSTLVYYSLINHNHRNTMMNRSVS